MRFKSDQDSARGRGKGPEFAESKPVWRQVDVCNHHSQDGSADAIYQRRNSGKL